MASAVVAWDPYHDSRDPYHAWDAYHESLNSHSLDFYDELPQAASTGSSRSTATTTLSDVQISARDLALPQHPQRFDNLPRHTSSDLVIRADPSCITISKNATCKKTFTGGM
ncbi:hypothetical protein CC1G_12284 [Coprinopsis cinerea okayama7|uniref:Uncharacterized protein n=1 Tax=Coprinopsis cinerea (strain Okayama-7 / 130 / ATCC MYA-4618 / FGSC 9003) TaxID=240176 RepID=A8MZS4_COPC7|nr:hypothetical protein CC1G_12284 [Coprinopsis cinerea okayama7\|eukprot:XP_001828136.2 hypothetical protein CC1G_12284 [Coprinopsis cinerea okayama7\